MVTKTTRYAAGSVSGPHGARAAGIPSSSKAAATATIKRAAYAHARHSSGIAGRDPWARSRPSHTFHAREEHKS